MRLPSRSAAINSRSFHGLSSGSETIFACAAFHCAKSSSTSALLSRLSQKRIGPILPCDSRKERLVINSLQFPLEMPAMLVSPIEGEAQRVDIVACGLVDVGRG